MSFELKKNRTQPFLKISLWNFQGRGLVIKLEKPVFQNFDFWPKNPKKRFFVPKITKNRNFEKIFLKKKISKKYRGKSKKWNTGLVWNITKYFGTKNSTLTQSANYFYSFKAKKKHFLNKFDLKVTRHSRITRDDP